MNYEIVVLDNDSVQPETLNYLNGPIDPKVRVLKSPGAFNYSLIMNEGVAKTSGEIVCLLNNDTVVNNPQWLAGLVGHLQSKDVGIVGSLLTYPSGDIQHAGIALGYTGVAGHVYSGLPLTSLPTSSCFETSAVTFACAAITRDNWQRAKGLDELFKVGLNDVDFCLKMKSLGLRSVVCQTALLTHFESQSRPSMTSLKGSIRATAEVLRFTNRYATALFADPYFAIKTDNPESLNV
jgi:GT2 family glycosyltransferase